MKRVKNFFKDFKAFISRGNILDLAIGVIIGSAFSAIVTAFTNKIIMPLINWALAAITGGNGFEGAYTILGNPVYLDEAETIIDWTNTIYIDWGAFITAILNFLIIAMVLFLILKAVMSAKGFKSKVVEGKPTKEEREQLKTQGVNMKDRKAVAAATAELREKNKPVPEPPKPTQEELLAQILEEMKKNNAPKKKIEEPAKSEVKKTTSIKKSTKKTK